MKRAYFQICGAVAFIIGGGALFSWTQHVPLLTSMYWSVTTASTVGYGDIAPHNSLGRVISIIMMLTAIPLLGAAFANLTGEHLSKRAREERVEIKAHVETLLAEHHPHMIAQMHAKLDDLHDQIHERLDAIEQVLNGEAPPVVALAENPPDVHVEP